LWGLGHFFRLKKSGNITGEKVRNMREVGYLDITDNKRLVLSISEFRGEERIDLRENYLNKEGAYNPTKKGINFNAEWLDKFVTMVEKLKNI
jgi:hypothetical protein